jgi:hypothetical protein
MEKIDVDAALELFNAKLDKHEDCFTSIRLSHC